MTPGCLQGQQMKRWRKKSGSQLATPGCLQDHVENAVNYNFSSPLDTPVCKILKSEAFQSADIATAAAGVGNDHGCCKHCAATFGCVAWTAWNGTCYLKDSSGEGSLACHSCVSGRLTGIPREQCSSVKGFDFMPDSENFSVGSGLRVESAEECCSLCSQTPLCVSWTVFKSAEYWGRQPCPSCISGLSPKTSSNITSLPEPLYVKGMTFTGGRYCPDVSMDSTEGRASLRRLASTGSNWVSIVVTEYQWQINSTEIFPLYDSMAVNDTTSHYYKFVTIKPQVLVSTIKFAKSLGLKVMLKPHIDLLRDNKPNGRFWRGDIGGPLLRTFYHYSEAPKNSFYPSSGCPAVDWDPPPSGIRPFTTIQWNAWFLSYTKFLLKYAIIAAEEDVEILSLNCELYCPNRQAGTSENTLSCFGFFWLTIELHTTSAYYKVSGETTAELVRGWNPHKKILRSLHKKYNKSIVFTEIGFCSGQCSRDHSPSRSDLSWHAAQYEAVFEAFRGEQNWFLGFFFWNWDTDPTSPLLHDDCLTPQGKPAEDVLRKYYRATEPKPDDWPGPGLCAPANLVHFSQKRNQIVELDLHEEGIVL
eukprot:UC4_evm2s1242